MQRESTTTIYEVRNAAGELVAEHHRVEKNGGKDCFWKLPGTGRRDWGLKGLPLETLPLYGSDQVEGWPEDEPVVLVEGEKARDALDRTGYFNALGTVCGSGKTPGAEALEVLRDRWVVLWPDDDEPGRKHMNRIAEDLRGVAAEVSMYTWHEAPDNIDGPDAADHPAVVSDDDEGLDRLLQDLMEAPRWTPPEPKEASTAAWPELAAEARYGLLGDALEAIEPHTEADPAAVLINLLVAFGSAAGRGAHVKVGADRHGLNLFAVLVGETAKGRKGMSWGFAKDLLHAVERPWVENRVLGGLSSGEGLIYAVRDEVMGTDKDGDLVVVDEGVSDKRLLAIESEFAGVLKTMTREGNTLSAIVRQAWDGGRLQTLTRNSPLKATDPHVSVVGHVTRDEVLRHLSENDTGNGFANRFLWIMVRRSRVLPFGGKWSETNVGPLVKRLKAALEFAKTAGELRWGESAKAIWARVYEELSEGEAGLFGAATSRAEAQVLRLAAIYAVVDHSHTIKAEHLKGALAVWEYAEESARYIFGDATGDPVADRIMGALRKKSEGMSRTEIARLFGSHRSAARIDASLSVLKEQDGVRSEKKETGGRPVERWFAK